jgi:hypothetical protein
MELGTLVSRVVLLKVGMVAGRFLQFAGGQLLVAVDVPDVKTGTWFGPDLRATKARRRASCGLIYQPYDNAYKCRRAHLTHIRWWALMRLSEARCLNQLALTSFAVTYGDDPFADAELFANLHLETMLIVNAVPGEPHYQNNEQMRRAVALLRAHTSRLGSRKRLGLASVAIRTADRAAELDQDQQVVVSLGTVVDQYIGGVIEQVKVWLPGLEDKLKLLWQEMYTDEHRDFFVQLALHMEKLFVARPFVNPGAHCVRDAKEVARAIGYLMNASRGQQSSSMEDIRQLIKNIVDCCKLLVWQYQLEVVITEVSDALKWKTGIDWNGLCQSRCWLEANLPDTIGYGFKNNVVTDIRAQLKQVSDAYPLSFLAPQSVILEGVKLALVRASNCVGSKPPEPEKVA